MRSSVIKVYYIKPEKLPDTVLSISIQQWCQWPTGEHGRPVNCRVECRVWSIAPDFALNLQDT